LGITNDTLVIFSSDNGPARASKPAELRLSYDTATGAGWGINAAKGITGGRKGYKSSLFEGGIGVPFIARWPGKIAAGKVDSTSLMSAVDLLPTFCELASVSLPEDYRPDGISQVETLLGKSSATRSKALLWKMQSTWPIQESRPYHWVSYVVVDRNWKLLTNRDASYLELYDITADPFEKTDLKAKEPDTVRRLSHHIEEWKKTLPDNPVGDVFSRERSKR
jgi:arylsulfatase A-like enzyme